MIDGPFTEAKELVAGFWVWKSNQWMRPSMAQETPFKEGEVEIRQIFEAEDFGAEFTPEARAQEERIRAEAAKRKGKR